VWKKEDLGVGVWAGRANEHEEDNDVGEVEREEVDDKDTDIGDE
jgi:hypothetical protein